MSTANPLELGMLALINDERAVAGLEPLRLITLLNDAAETHSAWMLETNQFSHSGDGGSSPSERMEDSGYPFEGANLALENIGWQSARGEEGFADDVAQMHASLMNSPGHRANILDPDAQDIGIGIETGTFSSGSGDFEAVMVTQVFGSTDADISAFVDEEIGDETPEVADDMIAEEEGEDDPDTPPAPETVDLETEQPETGNDEPILVVDDDVPVIVVDDDTPVVAEDVPVTDEDWPEVEPEPAAPPQVIAMDDMPLDCAPSSLTVDLSDVFDFNRDGEQITLETTQEKLITAFQNAIDDWTFMLEAAPAEAEVANISDLMIDGMADNTSDAFSCDLFEDDDEEVLALQCM